MIFVLPFDYDRISSLIVKEKGVEYHNYLSKIVNSKFDIPSFAYSDLYAIFVSHIKGQEIVRFNDEQIKNSFEAFIYEYSSDKFRKILTQESEFASKQDNVNAVPVLHPVYAMYEHLFELSYVGYSYPGEFTELLKLGTNGSEGLLNALTLHASHSNGSLSDTLNVLLRPVKYYLRRRLSTDVGDQLNDAMKDKGIQAQEKDWIESIQNNIREFHGDDKEIITNFESKLQEFWDREEAMRNDVDSHNYLNDRFNNIRNIIQNYLNLFDENLLGENTIMKAHRDWLVSDVSPRELKRFAIYLGSYPNTVYDSKQELNLCARDYCKSIN
jgi:hypothetical protein